MDEGKEILLEIRHLNEKLYGANGFKGDIPEIRASISKYCDKLDATEKELNKWVTTVKVVIAFLIGSGVLGGSYLGILKLVG